MKSCATKGCDREPTEKADVLDGEANICGPCRRAYRVGVRVAAGPGEE